MVACAVLAAWSANAGASLIDPSTDASSIASAMSSQPGLVTGASWPDLNTSNPSSEDAAGVGHGFVGNYMPDDGTSFAALTNGSVLLANPPNDTTAAYTDNGTSYGGANDVTMLRVDLNVPSGANCLSFDGVFYSEEYPEFVGIQWNDGFIAELDGTSWAYSNEAQDVDAPRNFAFDENGRLLEVNTVHFADEDTGLQYDGSSKLLTAATPITPGAHSIYLSIYDAGDHNVDSAVFLDHLHTSHATNCAPGAADADTDADGLPDSWELHGLDVNGDGRVDVDLPAMGADPNHKDVFVQLNSMEGLRLGDYALSVVQRAFQDAPVGNPDGTTGIHLHVDTGPTSVMNPVTGQRWGSLSQARTIPFQKQLSPGGDESKESWWRTYFDPIKATTFSPLREPVFHFALSVNRYDGGTSSGASRGIPGSDFIVALGPSCSPEGSCPGPAKGQEGTFMHELGHNLGLQHGGQVETNNVPNYLSIMNYRFQLDGLQGSPDGVDYSRFKQDDLGLILDESALDENAGFGLQPGSILFNDAYRTVILCAQHHFLLPDTYYLKKISLVGAVDFNCNGSIDDGTVAAPLDAELDASSHDATDVLAAFEDWSRLKYKGGAVGGSGLGALLPDALEDDEPTLQTLQASSDALTTPPEPTTGGADGVGETSATVHGSVDPHADGTTHAYFQYDAGDGFGSATAPQPVATASPVSVVLDGLAPDTTYHYRLVAESDSHLTYGATGSFHTGGAPSAPAPPPAPAFEPPIGRGSAVTPAPRAAHARLRRIALARGGVLLVTIACARGRTCQGRVTVSSGHGRHVRFLATKPVRVAAGRTSIVHLTLAAGARRALQHHLTLRVRVRIALSTGGSATRNVRLRG